MSKIKETIFEKQDKENIELDARYQLEVVNNKENKTNAIPKIRKNISSR